MANRLGKYRLVKQIAQGGMAEIFLARQEGPAGFEREVVVKRILSERASDPQFVAMFQAEARVAAAMSHPNIVQIIELGEHEGTYFIAMEAVRGVSVGQLIERMVTFGLRVPARFAARIISDVCAGLAYAHRFHVGPDQRGVLHRDVSPDNILVSYNGAVKIIDFGVARAMDDSSSVNPKAVHGKMRYMAPERAEGHPADARSDLFGLAIVLYELLTGEHPFGVAKGLAAATANARNDPRPPREIVPDLEVSMVRALERGLQRDPDARYPSADALRNDLEGFLRAGGPYIGDTELGEFVSSVVRGGEDDLVWLRNLGGASLGHSPSAVRDAGKLGGVGVASGHLAPAVALGPRSVSKGARARRFSLRRLAAMLALLLAVAVLGTWLGVQNASRLTTPSPVTPPQPSAPSSTRNSPPTGAMAPSVESGSVATATLDAQAQAPGARAADAVGTIPGPGLLEDIPPAPTADAAAATPGATASPLVAPPEQPVSASFEAGEDRAARPWPSDTPEARARPIRGASMRGTGRLSVTSNIPGARVAINGREVGVTPFSLATVEGEHNVAVTVGSAVRRAVLHVADDHVEEFVAEFGVAHLRIRGVPVGVVCSLDGGTLARATWEGRPIQIVEGRHDIVCDDPAGPAQTQRLDARSGGRYMFTWPR